MLQGFPECHTDDIPTCALFSPSSLMPVAYNIAWEAPWDFGWVIVAETVLSFFSSWRGGVIDNERMYCEALLEVKREAFARILNWESILEAMPIAAAP